MRMLSTAGFGPHLAPRRRAPRSGGAPAGRSRGSLTAIVAGVLGVESVLLLALGVAGMLISLPSSAGARSPTAQTPTEVLVFRVNPAYSALLIATAVLGLATLWFPAWRRRFLVAQTIGYLVLYVFGLAFAANTPTDTMWNLNAGDHALHAVVFILGLTLVLLLYSSSFEPPVLRRRRPERPTGDNGERHGGHDGGNGRGADG